MPVLVLPFSNHLLAASSNALWWLHISSSDLESMADSALWFWLNEESPVIQEMLSRPSSEKSKITARFMKTDLTRQLVSFALLHEEFDAEHEYEEGSLGAVLAAPVKLFGEDMTALRARFRDDPNRIEAELQGRAGVING
jgi:hypothetical protein